MIGLDTGTINSAAHAVIPGRSETDYFDSQFGYGAEEVPPLGNLLRLALEKFIGGKLLYTAPGVCILQRMKPPKNVATTAEKHRDAEGKLVKPTSVQPTLSFGGEAATTSLSDITKAEALFTMSLAVKAIPFAYADTASRTFPLMFPDSKIAESFSCGRTKASYIVSDELGPHFKSKVIDEVSWPDVYYTIQIDETPKPEQRVQQLDILLRYFSKA
ncbi:hypothetical protein MTO96_008362 [Rhipicephalus appendiculatus]